MIYKKVLNDFLIFFFIAFIFTSAISIAMAQITFGISLFLFILLFFVKRPEINIKDIKYLVWAISALLIWQFISSLKSPTPSKSLFLMKEEWLYFIIPVGIFVCRKAKYRLFLMNALASAVVLSSIYGLIQFFFGVNWFSSSPLIKSPVFGYQVTGFFGHRVTFGNYFCISAVVLTSYTILAWSLLTKTHKYLLASASALAALLTILSFGRSPILALIITLFIMILILKQKYMKKTLPVLIIIIIIVLSIPGVVDRFLSKNEKAEASRSFIWNNTLKLINDNSIFGVGKGNFKNIYSTYLRSDINEIRKVSSAHNDFLDIVANSGIPAGIFYIILWLVILIYLWTGYLKVRRDKNNEQIAVLLAVICGSICYLITSMVHSIYFDDELRQLLMFLWAFGLSIKVYGNGMKPYIE